MINFIFQLISFLPRLLVPYKLCFYIQMLFVKKIRSFWLHKVFLSCHNSVLFGKIGRINGGECIQIAKKTSFDDFFYLCAWPKYVDITPTLIIGSQCNFGAYNHISCTNKVVVGDNVLTGKWVTISDNNHGDTSEEMLHRHPSERPIVSKGPIVIEDDVWIGDKVTILAGVHIGKGAVIAANAVVTKDVPAYCVAAGNPARIIKQ